MPTDPVPPTDRTLTVVPTGPDTLAVDEATAHALPAGRRFGDYDLLDELARGGMGVVYKARQRSVNRVVALKMILAGRFASATDVQRFKQEAESAAHLDHPNVLPIYEVGEAEGRSYFTMKLVEGGSLSDLLKESPRTNVRGLVALMEQVSRGVHYAHQRGVLHRDLKPSNILQVDPATPVIADFGLAKKVEGDSSLTQSGSVLGTPSYMAPEQARGSKAITTAADVYSLGAILYEVLTGRPPFKGETIAQTLRMVEEQEPVPPRRVNPSADADLEAVALKCLEKDPTRRYETAGALADDLGRWLRNEPVTARRAGPTRRAGKWVRRNPVVAGLSVTVVLAVAAGSVLTAVFAARADRRAAEAAASEGRAKASQDEAARSARDAQVHVQNGYDLLARGEYEQARGLRLIARPGWRSQALERLARSARNLRQPRPVGEPDYARPADLPDPADLRGEAIMALTARDARLVREIPLGLAGTAHFSGNGGRMLQLSFDPRQSLTWGLRGVDLTSGQELYRQTVRLDTKKPDPAQVEAIQLINLWVLDADGTRAACAGMLGGGIDVREVPSGRLAVRLVGPPGPKAPRAAGARFSPDGRRVAAVRADDDGTDVVVWDVDRPDAPRVLDRWAGKPKTRPMGFMFGFGAKGFPDLRFSPDGTRLCLVRPDRKAARVLDVTADPPGPPTDIPVSGELMAAEWHPTEPVLALVAAGAGRKASVVLWDLKAGKARATCDEEFSTAGELGGPFAAFSPDGQWLAVGGSGDPTVRVFGAQDGAEQFRLLDAATIGVYHLFWTPAGDLAVAGVMESVRLWRPDPDPGADAVPGLRPAGRPAASPDGRWLAAFAPTATAATGGAIPELLGEHDRPALDRVALVDRRTRVVARYLPGLTDKKGEVFFSPDGGRVVVAGASEIVVREAATGDEVLRRVAPKEGSRREWLGAFFAPDGRLLALAGVTPDKGKRALVLWDATADRAAHTFDRPVAGLSMDTQFVSPDGGRLFLPPAFTGLAAPGKPDDRAKSGHLYELPAARLLAEVPPPPEAETLFATVARLGPGAARALWISADLTGAGASPAGAVWTVRALPSGEEVLRVPNKNLAESASDFSPDGRFLALGSDRGHVELWDLDARALVFRWQPHGGKAVRHLAFAPDGDLASVTDGDDRLVTLRLKEVRARLTEMGLGW